VQQVGSYLGYCGRGTDAFGKAARGPKAALQKCGYCAPVLLKIFPSFMTTRQFLLGSSSSLMLPLPDAPARTARRRVSLVGLRRMFVAPDL